ncbi:hypothetical protein G5C60_47115 [Streptomyces sp. HC44]|uniref:Uncharacterized protein n=1 Tax=Streptomyces scabichelini TaxID=2711217 RepID=A0A6G4VLB2_9ACTN|nr:hypothetical protein [Streptomyces scabichelini]NGO14968.1 hypothetical protein [Streptomyces scabichelini]
MMEAGMETRQCVDPCAPLGTASPSGGEETEDPCDLVTVPTRQGLEAVDILRRGASEAVGPVLHDGSCDTLGFLVPAGTADAWDVPGSTCTQTDGRGVSLVTEAAGAEGAQSSEPPVEGSGWLLSPEESDLATDPVVLRAALDEAARLIEAADNCR